MSVMVSGKHKVVGVPLQKGLEQLFPGAKVLAMQGGDHIILPHIIDVTTLLRNMDIEVPAPVLSQYDWCTPMRLPFEVQKKTVAMMTMHKRAYVLNGMGTGKTKSAIWAYDYLRCNKLAGKMLVVAPLSTLSFTWMREIFETANHLKAVVLHGSRAKRLEKLASDADIYIINHDGVKVIFDELLKRTDIDTICIDELAAYRNYSTDRTKTMAKIAATMQWAWGMTGSPTPSLPTDVYGQARVITPDSVPKFFNRFRDALMTRITQFKFAPKPDATEKAFSVMQPAVRYTLDDILELPQLIEREVQVNLGPKQDKVYKTMVTHSRAMLAAGEVSAMNAGALMNKLLQISTGYVYDSKHAVQVLDNDLRLQQLTDDVNACNEKVLVFVPFKHTLQGVYDHLTKEGIECASVSGDTPQGQRAQIFNAFQNTSKYKCIVAHPQCMSHGLTLTAATLIVWFAPITSLETFDQANARIRRVGQKHKQRVLMYWSTPIEKKVYSILRKKQSVQSQLLQMFEEDSE
jgi:SNF2 family DNA or RNA helicase